MFGYRDHIFFCIKNIMAVIRINDKMMTKDITFLSPDMDYLKLYTLLSY